MAAFCVNGCCVLSHTCLSIEWVHGCTAGSGMLFPPLYFIFGMGVLHPWLQHSWWISMHCVVVTGTGADMLSHCDEKHSEMMWRECSYCPQRDGRLAVLRSVWVYGCMLGYSAVALPVVHFILFGPASILCQRWCNTEYLGIWMVTDCLLLTGLWPISTIRSTCNPSQDFSLCPVVYVCALLWPHGWDVMLVQCLWSVIKT